MGKNRIGPVWTRCQTRPQSSSFSDSWGPIQLAQTLLNEPVVLLAQQGLFRLQGTIDDTNLIAAPPSTNTCYRLCNPEMSSTPSILARLQRGYEHKTVCHGRGEYERDEDALVFTKCTCQYPGRLLVPIAELIASSSRYFPGETFVVAEFFPVRS